MNPPFIPSLHTILLAPLRSGYEAVCELDCQLQNQSRGAPGSAKPPFQGVQGAVERASRTGGYRAISLRVFPLQANMILSSAHKDPEGSLVREQREAL